MTRPVSLWQLTDGPLVARQGRREAVIRDMGACLLLHDAFRDRDAAKDALLACGYPTFDVFTPGVVDDAMQVAAQELVAAEMSRAS